MGADVNGLGLKDVLKEHMVELGHEVADFSTPEVNEEVDYPDVAQEVAQAVADEQFERAVLICGTGIGMSIVANKVPGVRAANVSDPYSAERARKSNDAQVLCLGSFVIGKEVALLLIDHWLDSEFQGGRSARKVAKIAAIDAPRVARSPQGS